ncbi:hypothetical protein FJY71_09995 [candidate division WOR-3 bacterium]|nr:hypothetical protein [candidate division WOR-3 bacterium]
MRIVIGLMVVLVSVALPATKCYDVIPYRNCIASAPGGSQFGVSQFFRMTVDSVTEAHVWVGDRIDTAGYRVVVKDSATGVMLAQTPAGNVHPDRSWYWMSCPLVTTQGRKPVRGKTYEMVVTRPVGRPIAFAYDPTGPYKYGNAVANGSNPSLPDSADVAMRIYGQMDAVDSGTCAGPATG